MSNDENRASVREGGVNDGVQHYVFSVRDGMGGFASAALTESEAEEYLEEIKQVLNDE